MATSSTLVPLRARSPMQALLGSLTDGERALVRETERGQMAGLDEDALVALHVRVRDKYVGLYRRSAASRVSRRLAAAARASALQLKQERIAEARAAPRKSTVRRG